MNHLYKSEVLADKELAEKLQDVQKTGLWTITYAGANQDLTSVASDLSIPFGNVHAFTSTTIGTRKLNALVNSSVATYTASVNSGKNTTNSFYAGSDDKNKA